MKKRTDIRKMSGYIELVADIRVMDRTGLYGQKNNELIGKIVSDRNVYTHSSNRVIPQLSFDEIMNIATICKQIYRILLLKEMGIPNSLLVQRIGHNRLNMAVFEKILGIKLSLEKNLSEYDSAMWHFSDSK